MEMWKNLFEKACAEGLMPFMMMHTNGSKSKRNAIRVFEILLVIIPLILSITYYGGKMVHSLEVSTQTLIKMQETMDKFNERQVDIRLELQTVSGKIDNHLDFERDGSD